MNVTQYESVLESLAAPEEEEDEGKEPTAKLQKSVDEPEDKKEEYDEDDDDGEKATVDVIKPVPEPEEEEPKTEPTGESLRAVTSDCHFLWSVNFLICDFSVSLYALCKDQRDQDCRNKRFVLVYIYRL